MNSKMPLDEKIVSYYKNDVILDLIKDKNVLHIGACDSPYSKERCLNGSLLHCQINTVGNKVVGLDIDRNSIKDLRDLGIDNIFYGNIVDDVYEIDLQAHSFDYIIMGDVIEHLDNPGFALTNIRKMMTERMNVIITVPNCFSYNVIKNLINQDEDVHPDHVFWTSKATMEKMLKNQGFQIIKFQYCFYGSAQQSRIRNKIGLLLLKQFPKFLSCLIFVVCLDMSYPSSES